MSETIQSPTELIHAQLRAQGVPSTRENVGRLLASNSIPGLRSQVLPESGQSPGERAFVDALRQFNPDQLAANRIPVKRESLTNNGTGNQSLPLPPPLPPHMQIDPAMQSSAVGVADEPVLNPLVNNNQMDTPEAAINDYQTSVSNTMQPNSDQSAATPAASLLGANLDSIIAGAIGVPVILDWLRRRSGQEFMGNVNPGPSGKMTTIDPTAQASLSGNRMQALTDNRVRSLADQSVINLPDQTMQNSRALIANQLNPGDLASGVDGSASNTATASTKSIDPKLSETINPKFNDRQLNNEGRPEFTTKTGRTVNPKITKLPDAPSGKPNITFLDLAEFIKRSARR